jgi:excisionase family DNA binding protein
MSEPMSLFEQRLWRAQLTPWALLSEAEVLEALPVEAPSASAWLATHVQPRARLGGQSLYCWGDVLDALPVRPRETASASRASHQGLRADGLPTDAAETTERDWLTVAEACQVLGVSERLFRRLLAEGALMGAAARVGRTWRLHRERLEQLLTSGLDLRTPAAEPALTRPPQPPRTGLVPRSQRSPGEPSRPRPPSSSLQVRRGSAAAYRAFLSGVSPEEETP